MILYTPPTLWGLLRGAAINLLLPFINGLMLGFGELFAHEAAFRLGWGGTKVKSYDLLDLFWFNWTLECQTVTAITLSRGSVRECILC